MRAAETLATPLTELLTWPEIVARFPYQYVVVLHEDHDISRGEDSMGGRVLSNGRWPREVTARIDPDLWRDPNMLLGVHYTGHWMPDDNEDRDPVVIHR